MKTKISILSLCIFSCICGCAYDPWENESYQCEDSHWIAPHNYKQAFITKKTHGNVLLGDLVIQPFLAPSGGFYNGHSPYRMWFQVFAGNGTATKLKIKSLTCKRSGSPEPFVVSKDSVTLDLTKGYAAHTFQTPIPLDFDNKESAIIMFEFTVVSETTTNIQRRFEFKPVLQKGSFESLN